MTFTCEETKCMEFTSIIGISGSYDAGNSGTVETGAFRSTICDKSGKPIYYRGGYIAVESGAGATSTGASAGGVATVGGFNGRFTSALVGGYTNTGADFSAGVEGGVSYLRTLKGDVHGVTIEFGVGTPEAAAHATVGVGEVYWVEVYRNGEWQSVSKDEMEALGDGKHPDSSGNFD